MEGNPEEGRLTPEKEAILLRKARRRTVEMRRQLRDETRKRLNQERAQRWQDRHREGQYEVEDRMQVESNKLGPQNRRARRAYAKAANAFKIKGGWLGFNESYKHRFGYQTSISRNNRIADAMKKGE